MRLLNRRAHRPIFLNENIGSLRTDLPLILQVIHAARANASHNHGLDPDRLIIGMY